MRIRDDSDNPQQNSGGQSIEDGLTVAEPAFSPPRHGTIRLIKRTDQRPVNEEDYDLTGIERPLGTPAVNATTYQVGHLRVIDCGHGWLKVEAGQGYDVNAELLPPKQASGFVHWLRRFC